MTAASLVAARPRSSATWRTAGWLVGRTLRILAVVAPLMLLMAVGVAPAVMAYFAVEAPGSVWSFAVSDALTFFTLVIAALTMAHLPIHLAFGMTRRSFAAAVVLTVLGIAVVWALVVPLGYGLEGAHFRARGWAHPAPDGHGVAMVISALRTAVWGLAGALNAAIWYRFGGLVGVVAVPFAAIAPIAAAAILIDRAAPFGPAEASLLVGLIALLGGAHAAVVSGITVKARTA